ncbi:hypothetical protein Rsub_05997 [Raphidocelis subcapitata]|uniref:ATP synthase mitochondrial F1 complex assembly factor 2 n=1 Tax=Raphidocelis subcapitata TaxID=307507 RepID=A0A2V0P848_9CHLO|nr:hypothetical protein Rsub_05997 [Raphidocelis subcapitata]|eukprot:GBF93265.1 hypothetical protein Rsub_05997 [Raphidocelis subcapitata]
MRAALLAWRPVEALLGSAVTCGWARACAVALPSSSGGAACGASPPLAAAAPAGRLPGGSGISTSACSGSGGSSSSGGAASGSSDEETLPGPDVGSMPAAAAAAAAAEARAARASLLSGKRFYETVLVKPAPGQPGSWQLLLGQFPVRTPARNLLVLPSYPLALALAAEWEWLPEGKPIHHTMPLMSLAATAIDQPKPRARVVEDLLKYAHTDATCVRYEPGPLARRQAAAFDPLLAWAREEMGWELEASADIAGPTQPAATIEAVRRWLEGLDSWRLAAVEQLTAACKSVVLAAALLRGRLSPEAALAAARLEEAYQIEDWGEVEAGHDLDAADMGTRVAAPAVMPADRAEVPPDGHKTRND